MKNIFLLIALFAFTCANAQQWGYLTPRQMYKHEKKVAKSRKTGGILWDYDTVFYAGVPNCIIIQVEHLGNPNYDYSIRSLSGQELIYVSYVRNTYYDPATNFRYTDLVGHYNYYFSDTKTDVKGPLNDNIDEIVVKYSLIQNGQQINPNGEDAFIKRFGGKRGQHVQREQQQQQAIPRPQQQATQQPQQQAIPQQQKQATQQQPQQPTQPDTSTNSGDNGPGAGISISDNQVMQGNTKIGYISTTRDSLSTTISVYQPNGNKVAEATSQQKNPQSILVNTTRDKASNIVTSNGDDVMTVINYLISKGYL